MGWSSNEPVSRTGYGRWLQRTICFPRHIKETCLHTPRVGWVGENKISATASRVTRTFNMCCAVQQLTQQNCLKKGVMHAMNVKTQNMHEQAGQKNMSTCIIKDMRVQDRSQSCFATEKCTGKTAQFSVFENRDKKHTQNKALSITMERCLIVPGVYGFLPSSKGFDMLHSNSYETPFKKELSRKLSRKIKESMSQASQRVATTTLCAERLQWMQRTSFCHGSHSCHSCAWGGQAMNQFPELVMEDGCSEPSVSRGISRRHAFTHPTSYRHGSPASPRQLQLCCQVGQEGPLLMGHPRCSRLC